MRVLIINGNASQETTHRVGAPAVLYTVEGLFSYKLKTSRAGAYAPPGRKPIKELRRGFAKAYIRDG